MIVEDILFWCFIGFLIVVFITLFIFIFSALYRMGRNMKEYEKAAEELRKEGIYLPPWPAAR